MCIRDSHYPDGSQIGIPDLVIPFPEIFLEGNNKDHFFLVKVPYEIPEDKFVKTIEFIPGNKKLAHHMNANLIEYEPGKKKNVFGGEKIIATNLAESAEAVSYTHLRAHETVLDIVCRLLLEKKKKASNLRLI